MLGSHLNSSDYSRGSDTFFHSARMFIHSTIKIISISVLAGLFAASVTAYFKIPTNDKYIVSYWVYSSILANYLKRENDTVTLEDNGNSYTYPATYFANHPSVLSIRDAVKNKILFATNVGAIVAALLAVFLVAYSIRRGRKIREQKLIRGGKVIPDNQLARLVKKRKCDSDIHLGCVPLVRDTETNHTLVDGTTGMGKTQLISNTVEQIRKRGDAAVIYDSTGYYIAKFFRKGDIVLCGMDDRTPYWSPWEEIRHPADALRLATSLIPVSAKATDPFWPQAAQHLFSATLLSLRNDPDRSIEKLIQALSDPSLKQIADSIKGSPIAAALAGKSDGDNRFAQSIRGTLLPNITALQFLRNDRRDSPFSIREWVESIDHTTGTKPFVFILSRSDFHAAMSPLISMWLDTFSESLMSLPENPKRRLWFVIDELPNLNRLPSIRRLLAEARKYGAACLLGIQNVSQLRNVYGNDEASAIMGLCNTYAVFRIPNPDEAKWFSKLLGERDIAESRESFTYSAQNERDGVHLSQQHLTQPIIPYSEIMQLDSLYFFLKLSGGFPVTRTKIIPVTRKSVAPSYDVIDVSKTGWASAWNTTTGHSDELNSPTPISFEQPNVEVKP